MYKNLFKKWWWNDGDGGDDDDDDYNYEIIKKEIMAMMRTKVKFSFLKLLDKSICNNQKHLSCKL